MDKKFTARIVHFSEAYDLAYSVSKKIGASPTDFDIVVGIARGGFPPARLVCDFLNIKTLTGMQVRHYTGGAKEKEQVEITDPISIDLKGKNVLILDDVNDSGKTLQAAVDHLTEKDAAEIKTAVLHEKENTSLKADYAGDYLGKWKWLIYHWAVTEDLLEFLDRDEMLEAGEDDMRNHLSEKYDLEVERDLFKKVLALKNNYL